MRFFREVKLDVHGWNSIKTYQQCLNKCSLQAAALIYLYMYVSENGCFILCSIQNMWKHEHRNLILSMKYARSPNKYYLYLSPEQFRPLGTCTCVFPSASICTAAVMTSPQHIVMVHM